MKTNRGRPWRWLIIGMILGVLLTAGILFGAQQLQPQSPFVVSITATAGSEQPTSAPAPEASPQTIAAGQPSTPSSSPPASPTQAPTPTTTPTLTSSPTPTPTPTPTETPTLTPTPLYEADWSEGFSGWAGPRSWKIVAGMLVTDGSDGSFILAPYQPDTPNYAVEVEMQEISPGVCGTGYGIVVRRDGDKSYRAGFEFYCGRSLNIWAGGSSIAQAGFSPGTDWNTYRIEVKDNTIRLLINGAELAKAIDNQYLSPGQIGLWSGGVQVNVRSFKVVELSK